MPFETTTPRRLVLHIGTGKTGSTTIQYLLSKNRAALLAQGVCYPGDLVNHLPVARPFASNPGFYDNVEARVWNAQDPSAAVAEDMEKFRREMLSLPASVDKVIVSCEQFSRMVRDEADIERLRAMLSEFFGEMIVVVYLRRQDGHFASMYSQNLRRGVARKPGFQTWKEHGEVYDYEQLLNRWTAVFGAANIRPRIFERDTDKSFDVVADFMVQAELAPFPGVDEVVPRNPSMNVAGQHILREIGRSFKEDTARDLGRTALWKHLHNAVTAALPGTGWRPTQDEARKFVARFEATNEAVRRQWFPDRPTLFSTDYSHLPAEAPAPDKRADARAAHDVILHLLREKIARDFTVAKDKIDATKSPRQRRLALMANVSRDPKNVSARLDLAAFQASEGAFRSARHNINKALKLEPEDSRGLAMLESLPPDEAEGEEDTTTRQRPNGRTGGGRGAGQGGRRAGAKRQKGEAQQQGN